jgi:hypothetical protein
MDLKSGLELCSTGVQIPYSCTVKAKEIAEEYFHYWRLKISDT